MRAKKLRYILYIPILATLLTAVAACNAKEDDESEITVTNSIVAVKNFKLLANDSILKNLDSVSFSIDLNHGVIFNADSLPCGTDVSRLIPSITFANSMSKAELSFLKNNKTDTVVNYLTDPTDSIDFTHPVTLNVTAQDGVTNFSYVIKVNVHTVVSDQLSWALMSTSSLPHRLPNPVQQKTVWHDKKAYCLVQESDDSYSLSVSDDLNEGNWQITEFNPGYDLAIEYFTANIDSFYILTSTGLLLESSDCLNWNSTGETWTSILGGYGDTVLGIRLEGSDFLHTCYPMPEDFSESKAAPDFPIIHSSGLGIINTGWAEKPIAILACGLSSSGQYQSDVWGYDGNAWAVINNTPLPALESPMLADYVVFRNTQAAFAMKEFDAWLLFGGIDPEGNFNKTLYISLDNGITWNEASELMQLPESFPDLMGSDVIVANYPLSADLSDAWTILPTKTRSSYSIDGTEITWDCPYMFVFGGLLPGAGAPLNTTIWRGVINRLEFTPVI